MNKWPVHASWNGPIVMIGFGSVGRGVLPLILRHINCHPQQITVIDPSDAWRHLIDQENINFINKGLTEKNFTKILKPLLSAGPGQALIVNVSVNVSSLELMVLARQMNALYLDTVIEPWPGFYYNPELDNAARSNYAMREKMLQLGRDLGPGSTAVSCCGANPGMVSWLVKQALIDLAIDTKLKFKTPKSRADWASLMQRVGVKGIHVAERDTQVSNKIKPDNTFVNTWSIDGFVSEGLQPAELGWGTHEKKLPTNGKRHKKGCKAAIYLERPGADTRTRSWVPSIGPQFAFLVTHNEAISISDYFTVKQGRKAVYRPTCHYAYHPANDALLSLHEMFGNGGNVQPNQHILTEDEIIGGGDELGVFLYGHKKNAYWYGSTITMAETRKLAPNQNATGIQITSAVLAGLIWAIENPNAGVVEADEMDYQRCLEVQRPYLGKVEGTYTDWTPLVGRGEFFAEKLDRDDPWAFANIIVL
jgi:homospermidine synthase